MSDVPIELRQGRVTLALHSLSASANTEELGPSVLLLHALGGSSADWNGGLPAWPGPVYALDFSGHGASGWVTGGVYYPELLAADADAALQKIGEAHLVGAGIGAYAALLLAGARPKAVPGALLLPGAGLAGCGAQPDFDRDTLLEASAMDAADRGSGGDPQTRSLDSDPRPVDYAESFAVRARPVTRPRHTMMP